VRATKALFISMLLVGLVAGTAKAAPADVQHFTFRGSFAEALWFTSTDTSATDTYINPSKTRRGEELFVDQFTENFDGNGNFTGATDTFADVTTGFAFTIDATKLSSASVRGSALPATTCSYDADFNPIGCVETTIDVDATWAGQGPIGRDTFAEHFKSDGFSFTDHFHGTSRDATASGTVGGLTLTSSDIEFADMGKANFGETDICVGC